MKEYKRYIIAVSLLTVSFLYIFTSNETGVARIFVNLLTFAGIYGLAAIGINVHFGWTGLLNFGHAAFMGIGAYTTILLIPHALGREGVVIETGLPLPLAVIIGIEKYVSIQNAAYANSDAEYFTEYAKRAFGIESKNIKTLIDDKADFISSKKALFKWLRQKINKNQTEVFIFYSGHGFLI